MPRKRNILLFLVLSLCTISLCAREFSYTYKGNTLNYTVLDESDKTCMVKAGSNYVPGWAGNYAQGVLIIPEKANDGNSEYTVIRIGFWAFYNNTQITSVTIPKSIKVMEDGIFYQCTGLKEVIYNAESCEVIWDNYSHFGFFPPSVSTVTIGEQVKSIPEHCFMDCKIKEVVIPENINFIGEYAFDNTEKVYYKPRNCNEGKCFSPFGASLQSAILSEDINEIPAGFFKRCTNLTSINIPNTIKEIKQSTFEEAGLCSLNLPNSIISIGDRAFDGCHNLESITLPSSVISIGEDAFGYCSNLKSVELSSSLVTIGSSAFLRCEKLTSIYIPDSVVTIGSSAFDYCSNLQKVYIGKSLKKLDDYSFRDCNKISDIIFNAVDCEIKWSNIFPRQLNNFTIGESVEIISDNNYHILTVNQLFYNAIELNETSARKVRSILTDYVEIGENVKRIPRFSSSKQETLIIPKSVQSIEMYAFYQMDNLNTLIFDAEKCEDAGWLDISKEVSELNLIIGENVSYIPPMFGMDHSYLKIDVQYKAKNCEICKWRTSYFRSLQLGDKVYSIPEYFCNGAMNLKNIEFNNTLKSIGSYAFSLSGLENVIIPDNVETIGDRAFECCKELSSIILPGTLRTIQEGLFKECSNLKKITIPEGIISIKDAAFADCTRLAKLWIPGTIESIIDRPFKNCRNLQEIYYNSTAPVEAYFYMFSTNIYDDATLYVPVGGLENAKNTTPWRDFKNIKELDFSTIRETISDFDSNCPIEVYNLRGIKVNIAFDELPSGLYIIRQGDFSKKVRVM